MIHGDSVYDIIDKQDHASIQSELMRGLQGNGNGSSAGDNTGSLLSGTDSASQVSTEKRIFLCRMNVSRNARRQMRFGDQKVCITIKNEMGSFLLIIVGKYKTHCSLIYKLV